MHQRFSTHLISSFQDAMLLGGHESHQCLGPGIDVAHQGQGQDAGDGNEDAVDGHVLLDAELHQQRHTCCHAGKHQQH